ncbi:MAG: transglycosylase domain-containing protein, partial [Dehalococcoidia bacterium]
MSSLVVRRRLRARRRHRSSHLLRILLALGLGIVALAATGATVAIAAVFAVYQHYADDYLPITDHLRQKNIGLTEIYDRGGPTGGVLLGSLTNREAQLLNPVPLDQISEWMVLATVSTEDDSFYENPGVNVRGLIRAFYENYVAGSFGSGTGGSSITQQLIKNVYICPNVRTAQDQYLCLTAERTLDRKLREIVYALELTDDYTKDQILAWYLNQISYGGQYIGVQAAAQGYFRKNAADLTLGEAALLAGVPQSPTLYHPRLNCVRDGLGACVVDEKGRTTLAEHAKERQESVLDLMVEHGRITREQADTA